MPAANPQNTRKRQVKMVPHGPGGQRVRPTPVRVQSRTPAAKRKGVQVVKHTNLRNVPHGPGGQNVHPVVVKTKPRTHAQKVQGVKVVKQSAKHVRRQEQKAARKYITQNPIKGLAKSENRAVESLSMAPNKKSELSKVLHAIGKVEPVTVAGHTVENILKEGLKHLPKSGTSQHNMAAMTTPQLHVLANSGPSKTAAKVIENTAREALAIPATTVPTATHVLSPAYHHPGSPKAYVKSAERAGEAAISLPKEYVKAYEKKGAKGVGEVAVKHPLSTALTVAPIPRVPGLAAGRVATRLGKMPRIADRVLPETAMKQQVPRSRSYFKAKRQAKKGQEQISEKHHPLERFTKSPIERRVDENVDLGEDLARRAQSTTYHKAYKAQKKVVGKKQARYDAAVLAKKAQDKVRTEQATATREELALREKPKVRPNPEYVHGQNLRNSAADSARLERADGRESSARDLERQVKQLDAGLAKTSPTLPVSSGGIVRTFKDYSQAENAATIYNHNPKYQVEMAAVKHGDKYIVMPKSAAFRLEEHAANTKRGPIEAAVTVYNHLWRTSVLATHPTWYLGNTVEAAVRSLVEGVGPTSHVRGYKALAELKRIDRPAWEAATGHITKGGHLKMQAHLPEETRIDITGASGLADTARWVQGLRDKPGIREVGDGYNKLTDLTMGSLSGKVESFFQTGMLGRELARSPLMDGHILKTSRAAIEDAAKGMRETHNQVALGQAVDRMYGQYGKFSPGVRRAIAHYTPFIAWTMNSLNWLYHYLPKDHPVLTAAVASSQPYVAEWLKDKGLAPFVRGSVPPFLRGSVPTQKGLSHWTTRSTPFGIAASGIEGIAGSLLPQAEGAVDLMKFGINWKGQKVTNPDGTPLDDNQRAVMAALTFLEGVVPNSQQVIGATENYEKGARSIKKIVKPKSGKDIGRAYNPFAPIPPKKSTNKKSKSLLDSSVTKKQHSLLDKPKSKKQTSLLDSP